MTALATFGKGIARLRNGLGRLRKDQSGLSLIEFAVVAPTFLMLGMYGAEVAYMATVKMRVSQIALSVADNASRLGQTDNSGVAPSVTEADITAVLKGGIYQGTGIDLDTHGRIILTSLENDTSVNKQWIHWQRCEGDKTQASAYGNQTNKNGLNGTTIVGMGAGSTKVKAEPQSAVMFVEVYYEYQNLFSNPFGLQDVKFTEEAAYVIRDDRNLSSGVTGSSTPSSC